MGADADEFPDGFAVRGARRLTGGAVDARHDHRLAMAFAMAALGADGPTRDHAAPSGGGVVPGFFDDPRRAARVTADKVYLVGFMGAGKTTVGRALARRLDWRVEDIDERIERAEQRDIPTIFRQSAKPTSAQVERQVLLDLLPPRGVVVATGGGTFVDPANRALMNRDGAVAWLDAAVRPRRRADSAPTAGGRWPPIAREMERLYINALAAYAAGPRARSTSRARRVDAMVEQLSTGWRH